MAALDIANEIVRQIKAIDFWALAYVGTKQKLAVEVDGMQGLRLICTRGAYVDILLNEGQDLYEVTSWKAGRGSKRFERVIKRVYKEVFADMLPSTVCDAYDVCIGVKD